MLVDSHCHLDFPDFAGLDAVILSRAKRAVSALRFDRHAAFGNSTACAQWPSDSTMSGARSASIRMKPKRNCSQRAPLLERAQHPKVVGLGETGLDYFYEHSPRAAQAVNFRSHIAAARETGLPLIVHTRDADDDTIEILRDEMGKGAFTGLIHCFTARDGSRKPHSISASISRHRVSPRSRNRKSCVRCSSDVPLNRLLVETDAPYLAPVPMRGKRNEPAFVVHTAAAMAELKGVAPDELARATTDNFFRLFTKAARPQ